MSTSPGALVPWKPLAPHGVSELLSDVSVRWWLSGGAALDHWLERSIRERENVDVSVVADELHELIASLPGGISAWVPSGEEGFIRFAEAPQDANSPAVLLRDDEKHAWVLQVNVEDGTAHSWVYRRDPRLRLPWGRAVLDVDGIPTGAPEVQLVWKALRPRPEDHVDRDAVLPLLSPESGEFFATALLRIHPHSTWAIDLRSPFAPAKASWSGRAR